MLEAGVSRVVITPDVPVRMAGYADRKGPYDGSYEDIFLRALFLRDSGSGVRFVIVSADLIWWNPEIMEMLRPMLSAAGYTPDEVVFTATHDHSGPGTGNAFIPPLETGDRQYMEKLVNAASSAIAAAMRDAEKVSLHIGRTEAPLNVYRRVIIGGSVQMMPNYSVKPDSLMTVLSFRREDGSVKAALVHYPCHANLSHENMLQRDYPGILEDTVECEYPGSTVLFLQGCTGDMRPNSVLGDKFVPASREGVIAFGKEAGDYAIKAIRNSEECSASLSSVRTAFSDIPVDHDFSGAAPDSGTERLWKEWTDRKDGSSERLFMKSITAGGTALIFANAEIVKSYAEYARELSPGSLLTGYSDGMIGYIADRKQMEEGGYEPVGSAPYFAVAGRFGMDTEKKVRELIKEVLG